VTRFHEISECSTGNGVRTTYGYDQSDRQLATLKSKLPNGSEFQNITYTRDNLGNITKLANAPTPGGTVGGPSTQNYRYDDRYQLVGADGVYTGKDGNVDKYTLLLAYDSVHNTTAKTQLHEIVPAAGATQPAPAPLPGMSGPIEPVDDPANPAGVQDRTSYDYTYAYEGGKPHAPSRLGPITHAYDANGNLTDTVNTAASGKRRQYVWDEENCLACNHDTATGTVPQSPAGCEGATVRYTYDAQGDRVVKNGDGLHVYPSRDYSERDGTGYKHVFVGASRLVTKTVNRDTTHETTQSYLHTDHVGSSGYVTDAQGTLTEHLEYFAFGETWVQERTGESGTSTPHRFAGKEQDAETGLHYFGARYYNSRTQLWNSPDPALSDYLDKNVARAEFTNPATSPPTPTPTTTPSR
jgi:RHS repeat-associated protein